MLPVWALTDRERQIIRLTWHGLPLTAIAQLLGRSHHTVRKQHSNAIERLGLRHTGDPKTLAALALWRWERGI